MNYYIVDGQLYSSNELYHYGVKGMRWGFRKATLYSETNDRIGENYTDRQKKRMRLQAQSILKRQKKQQESIAKAYNKAAEKAQKKADDLVWKSEARQNRGDQSGFQKYQSKAWKQVAKYLKNKKIADNAIANSKIAQKRITDISEEKLKAGRDYVTNKRLNYILPRYWRTEERVDFKDNS